MLTKEELDKIRLRLQYEEVIYAPDGNVAGVVVFDVNSRVARGDMDVSVEKIPDRDDDVYRLVKMVDEMQRLLGGLVAVAEGVGPNKYGVYPLMIDTGVLGRLKEMAGHE